MRKGFGYLRISSDKRGEALGVERQRADIIKLAKRERIEIVEWFDDNDRTATKGLKARPDYVRMIKLVASGNVDVVLAYSQERLWRDELEHPLFMRMAREVGVTVHLVNGGEVDPGDANNMLVSTMLNAVAVMEAATVSRRINREIIERRKAGKFLGGARAFGHTQSRDAVVEHEAEAIRDAVERVLVGESLISIVDDWNNRGITTAGGKRWRHNSFAQMLRQERLIGMTYADGTLAERRKGNVGTLVRAEWPAIVDADRWHEMVRVLGARRDPIARPRAHVLSCGVLRCGRCGCTMTGGKLTPTRWAYRCNAQRERVEACGGMSIDGEGTEAHVIGAVLDRLDTREFAAAVKRATKASTTREFRTVLAALDRKRARLADIEAMFTAEEIDRAEYKRMREVVRPEIAALEVEVNEAQGAHVVPVHLVGMGEKLRTAWDGMTMSEQRDVLNLVLDHVDVAPCGRGRRWNPDRLSVVFRTY